MFFLFQHFTVRLRDSSPSAILVLDQNPKSNLFERVIRNLASRDGDEIQFSKNDSLIITERFLNLAGKKLHF